MNKEPERNELSDLTTFLNNEHCGNCIYCVHLKYSDCWCDRKEIHINWLQTACSYFKSRSKICKKL